MPRFPHEPATVVVRRPTGDEVWIGEYVLWEAEDDPPVVLTVGAMGEERYFPLSEIREQAPGQWEGDLLGTDQKLEVRPTYEADAVTSLTMGGMPRIPLPTDVIGYIHASSGVINMPELYAMTEDDGFVVTMMLNADAGIYVRYASAWHRIVDDDAVDGLSMHAVDDNALDLFDNFDRVGQLVHVGSMPLNGQPVDVTRVVADDAGPTPSAAPVVASLGLPQLSSADDVPGAIQAALNDPDIQWWVTRRVKAMGLSDVALPWE